jgi:signal transduction histidine kinase
MTINQAMLRASWRSWVSSEPRTPSGPWWLQWLWTLLFSAALAVVFTVLGFVAFARGEGALTNWSGWATWYGKNFIICLTVASVIHLLFDGGRKLLNLQERLPRWRGWQRTFYFAGVPMLGVLVGWPLGVSLAGIDVLVWVGRRDGANIVVGSVLIAALITFLMHHFFAAKARQFELEKRATEAQLQLLQAQIEPHFLFNTLANVHSLMDHDLAKSKHMLQSFTDYLRASLGALRQSECALAQELELAQNYLQLQQVRMDDRLQFEINASEAARAALLPPLLLQPLIENAVVHGLEPSLAGGTVQVRAWLEGSQLVLEVQDNGLGPDAPVRTHRAAPGTGLALANIRERLQVRYGGAASLHITALQPGTLCRIKLPSSVTSPQ